MKLGVPWRVKGIRPDARETAREAARRAGMSVGEWLNTVIIDSADEEGIRPSRRGYAGDEDDEDDQLFAVHERLDELTSRLERLHRAPAPRAPYARATAGPEAYAPSYAPNRADHQNPDSHLADAIARLDRRMEELVNANRFAPAYAAPAYAAPAYAPPPPYMPDARPAAPADAWTLDVDQAMAEISARMQALDADPNAPAFAPQRPAPQPQTPQPQAPAPQPQAPAMHQQMPMQAPPPPAPVPSQDLSGLEQHLRHITGQIEALRQQPQLEEGIAALRQALGEIARTLLDAMPRRAIEALEGEVRALAARLDNTRQSGVDAKAFAALEQGLAEVRDTLRTLTPAENLSGFREAVHSLAQKVDMLGASGPDANAFHQLETAITQMRGIVSHVASNEALEQLAGEVHALAQKVDTVASTGFGGGGIDHSNALEILDQRVAHIADALESRVQNGGSVPPQLEAVISGLSDKIERLQHSRSDDVAYLENRIAGLVEKLDASGARFSQLEAIERGLADLLTHIEGQHAAAAAAPAPPIDGLQRDLMRTQTSLEAVHGTLGHVVDRLAMLESDIRETRPQPQSQPQQPVQPEPQPQPQPYFQQESQPQHYFQPEPQRQMPSAAQLEIPGMPAAAGHVPVFAPEPAATEAAPPPSRAVAHAQAAAAMARANPKAGRVPIDPNLPPDHPLEPGSTTGRGRLTASPADRIAASEAALGRGKPRVSADAGNKSNFIAAARRAAKAAGADPTTDDLRAATMRDDPDDKGGKTFTQRVRSLFVGASVILIVGGGLRIATNLIDTGETASKPEIASLPAPTQPEIQPFAREAQPGMTAMPQIPTYDVPPLADVTGSLQMPSSMSPSYTLPPSLSMPTPPSALPSPKLPTAIGGATLRTAAVAGDAAAEYEIGLRYVEGRGVPANPAEAVRWLELAAKQGLAMAQFRLAGFYEKGLGTKKDIETARRLYKAAAEQGNAKAMHNLAVLYAEGAAVKPDYRTAAQWFRLASDHGVSDSQYNLAILYARGIGVDQNLVESYKWFALAADQGDQEAARKRDEVVKRLDPQSLATAKLAVQAFVPQPQPDAATAVTIPAGGWDAASSNSTEAVPAKPKRAAPVRLGSR
jgi:localization factor PodJL